MAHLTESCGPSPKLRAALDALANRGRAAWPRLNLTPEHFIAYVLRHLADVSDPVTAASSLNAPDLYLACACLHRVPGALEAFDQQYLSRLPALLAGCPDALPLVDEVRQILRERLLVGTAEEPPRIAQYQGRGALLRWLKVTAIRTALKLLPPPREEPQQFIDVVTARDPEMEYLKYRYRDEVKRAFEEAFATLSPGQRNLLRMSLLDGLSIDELANVFDVHRSTPGRWVQRIFTELLDKVKGILEVRLGLPPAEVDSLLHLMRSRLELSVQRLLDEPSEASAQTDEA
jgi:RNA polymerase sigma-70 factor (ECF subfamily)